MEKNSDWKLKFNEIFQICQGELKKTTDIGKKMLSASKTNSTLNESYEELGRMVTRALNDNELEWENPRVQEILKTIEGCKKDLEKMEEEVNDIRFSDEKTSDPEANEDVDNPKEK
ncbi:MAG: hypothetical protein CME60_12965 [Halobacteriovoraceae bacterium]|nr:hypothetical protein [Halobacteriovoraceae bacterium]|tara:strand:- start:1205 stop:1552 length:348 start_codon:yes stop_codon:yes gene_type:complete